MYLFEEMCLIMRLKSDLTYAAGHQTVKWRILMLLPPPHPLLAEALAISVRYTDVMTSCIAVEWTGWFVQWRARCTLVRKLLLLPVPNE